MLFFVLIRISFFFLAENLLGVVEGRSREGQVTFMSKGKELEETFVDEGFDMQKVWAYLTIKDLLKNKTDSSDNPVSSNV